ncbi:MAG: nucleoside triphosphate pyrophosphohydrolase [Gammaproteobacteria bacterium]|nr:nucleoside triphosphate pyrophosphohydrolase [Gammaproteobacteria bacterium]MBT5223427.1 nucleoside triphosphate pyrophosphohydrolase [Gammaproteobacteria bacterium]MBT5825061.1 nucleoside triphosphate pyrophosphohydrolase [Gammaproteobacteria bacterium]MBT5966966.1 nucleoside triphosphate pyrophosphohydrolase [Gammaproteobacteria bacterium]MBT6420480.1 nucleoside triphosphate pyrophosphohydrolase [Gammaproteobacteria bacterium]
MKNMQQLLHIMQQLRNPETGCSWDKKQDFSSLIPYTLEEAYEVVDAIERDDMQDLKSELGDLLFQVVFHAQLAEEQGLFDFEQVAAGIADKLTRRHPHVFADIVYASEAEQQLAWETLKESERAAKEVENHTILSGVAKNLPALVQCRKIQDRAANHGFDWTDIEPVYDKVLEELDEVKEAWESGDQEHIEEEIGDLLLVAVNLARHMQVEPEQALKKSTRKFSRRFEYIENKVVQSGREVKQCELEELDNLWNEAKIALKKV